MGDSNKLGRAVRGGRHTNYRKGPLPIEIQILELLSMGKTRDDIVGLGVCSKGMVNERMKDLLDLVGAAHTEHLMAEAFRRGWIK